LLKRNGAGDDLLYVCVQRSTGYFMSQLQAAGNYYPFDPSALSGLTLWLDAAAITGLADGDPVSSWHDISAFSGDAIQATTANQPTYKTGIQNGLPVVRFDATGLLWLQSGSGPLSNNQDFTIFAVKNELHPTDSTYGSAIWSGGDAVFVGSGFALYSAHDAEWVYNPYGSPAIIEGAAAPTSCCLLETWYDNTIGMKMYKNAVNFFSAGCPTYGVSPNTFVLGNNGALFGSSTNTGTDYMEIIIYDRPLTDPERAQVENYLNIKWGLGF
jgi:hypothetical protein